MFAREILLAFLNAVKNHSFDELWQQKKNEAYEKNKWFVIENINQALEQWKFSLNNAHAEAWLGTYDLPDYHGKTAGIIMAGNVPVVGMHDLLSALVSGYNVRVKTSSDDEVLPKFWVEKAIEYLPQLSERISFSDSMSGLDVAIATGSNNSARYFEYYFRNIPALLRKNRNSVAVLSGDETTADLYNLGHDVFDYFGLGCRNITHLFLPENYDFKPLFDTWEAFSGLIHHNKYANNYNYHKALLLMNLDPHMDTGFLLLKEKKEIYSPVGMLNYSFYDELTEVKDAIAKHADAIQCVCSGIPELQAVPLGSAQKTTLMDYADNVDTVDWLCKVKNMWFESN